MLYLPREAAKVVLFFTEGGYLFFHEVFFHEVFFRIYLPLALEVNTHSLLII